MDNDSEEMKRAITLLMQLMDLIKNTNKILIATTNILEKFVEALLRRFNYKFNFNNYSIEDFWKIYLNELRGKNFIKQDNFYFTKNFYKKNILIL